MPTDPDSKHREYALIGAGSRLAEINAERQQILTMYPELADEEPGARFFQHKQKWERVNVHDAARQLASPQQVTKRTRRTHTEESKAAAVGRAQAGEYASDIARDYGISQTLLRIWCDKAGVQIKSMPVAEVTRRIRAGRGLPPLVETVEPVAARVVEDASKLSFSDRLGRETLAAMMRHGGPKARISCGDLAEKEGVDRQNMNWRISVRTKAGHVKRTDRGVYEITTKGRAWYDKIQAIVQAT